MVFEKILVSDVPKGISACNYFGDEWIKINEEEFKTLGKTNIGEPRFEELFQILKVNKINFVFFTTDEPDYAVRIFFGMMKGI